MTRFHSACMLILVLAVPTWADELKTLNGKSLNGKLEKISDSEIVLNAAGKSASTPLPQVLELTLNPGKSVPSAEKYIEVELIDESIVRCVKVTFSAKEVTLDLTTGVSVKVPLTGIATVLRDAHDAEVRRHWVKLQADKKRGDRVVMLSKGGLNPIDGSLGAIDEANQTIKFKSIAGEIDAKLEKMQGLQFARVEVPGEASLCRVIDVDGNVLVASKLTYSGSSINLTTPFGVKTAFELKAVSRIDFNFGRLTFLSDLDAKSPEAVLLGGFNPVRKDLNLDGLPIMLQDKKYDKGLSMYAGAELEYNLAGKYKDFKAILGLDSRIAEEGQGKVTVTVYCDGEKRSTFEVSAKAPTPIAVNVKEIGTLRIVVSGSNFNLSGHATLANAHVSQ